MPKNRLQYGSHCLPIATEGEFEGFTLEDLRKGEESDVDLDLIVKEGQQDSDFFRKLVRQFSEH